MTDRPDIPHSAPGTPHSDRPNFVFILSDQQRRDGLGRYGNQAARTPNLDRIGSNGVIFESAFPTNVTCSPSRASILTGRFPRSHGLVQNGIPLDDIQDGGCTYLRTVRTPDCRLSYYLPAGDGELFDLRDDPDEFVNRWHDPGRRELRAEMTGLLLRATVEASDPTPEAVAEY